MPVSKNFNGERSRIRVKAKGMGSKLTILLLKKNDQDVFVEDKRFEIKEEGSIEQDLGILNGNYYIGILYNANQTIFRVAWEKEGE